MRPNPDWSPIPLPRGVAKAKVTKGPTIRDAREICERLGARGVIVLAFGTASVEGASYGETTVECRKMAGTLDEIVRRLSAGGDSGVG